MQLPEHFIIFDCEYTSWKNSLSTNWKDPKKPPEVVQIAAIKIKFKNNKMELVDVINIFVKPVINPLLSSYFKKLTKISQNTIDEEGISFKEAMNIFYNFAKHKGKKINLYSYGNDYVDIERNLNIYKFPKKSKFRKWKSNFFDIKDYFKNHVNVEKYSSGTLYKAFKIKVSKNIVKKHNALWDVYSLYLSLLKSRV